MKPCLSGDHDADRFDKLAGLYYVCTRWHSGQWSRGYRLLCRINFQSGTDAAYNLLPREEWESAREWAAHYTRLMRAGDISL